jgi:hypothetical protein
MSNMIVKGNAGGSGTFTLQSPNSDSSLTITLPAADGSATQVLTTNGSGALYFSSVLVSNGALGTPISGNLTNCTVDGINSVGYLNIPQVSKSVDYTLTVSDAGKHILHPSTDTNSRTFTIPAGFSIGTTITFINQASAGTIFISVNSETMRHAGTSNTGNRTLAANGIATCIKISATEWIISGVGLT